VGLPIAISPRADEDKLEIFVWVTHQSGLEAALAANARIDAAIERIGEHPGIGRLREEYTGGVRSLAERPWVVFYRVHADRVDIVRVLDGRRDLRTLL
jgi:plasmid stabilization system protein ParE